MKSAKVVFLLFTILDVFLILPNFSYSQDSPGLPAPHKEVQKSFKKQNHYSPYAGRNFPTSAYSGDTHVHTAMSMDAGAFGARLKP